MYSSHVYFMFNEFRGWPAQLSLSACSSSCPCEDIAFREKGYKRHPAASSRSQAGRVLICWRFMRGMKDRRGAAKSFKAWPSPPLVTEVAQHVLRGLWRNLAPLTLMCTSKRFLSLCWPSLYVCFWLCCMVVYVHGGLCMFVWLVLFGLWIPCSPVQWAMLCVILNPEIKTGPSIEASISDVTSPHAVEAESLSVLLFLFLLGIQESLHNLLLPQ